MVLGKQYLVAQAEPNLDIVEKVSSSFELIPSSIKFCMVSEYCSFKWIILSLMVLPLRLEVKVLRKSAWLQVHHHCYGWL